jgi:hypothetical protein
VNRIPRGLATHRAQTARPTKKITFLLDFTRCGKDAPFSAALDKGLWRDAGLRRQAQQHGPGLGALGGDDAAGTRRQPGARPGRRGHAEAASRKKFAGMLESARTRLIDARNNSLDSMVARSFSPSTRRS